MNKYDKKFHSVENERITTKYQKLSLAASVKFYALNNYRIEDLSNLLSSDSNETLVYNFFELDNRPLKFVEWMKINILPKLNKGALISLFIQNLTNNLIAEDIETINYLMESFKLTGLIKNIKLEKNVFYMTLLNGKIVKFTKRLDDIEQVKQYRCNCHSVSYQYFSRMFLDDIETYCVTIMEKGLYNKDRYHTFLLHDGIVHDLSRNFAMKYDDYKELFNFKILNFVNGRQMLKNIENLKNRDLEFKKSNVCDVLKYAMHKQLKKEKRI